MRLRLVLQPLAQFALSGALTIALAERALLAALALTFVMQLLWWSNIRMNRETDDDDRAVPYAGVYWATGATIGTGIALALAAWWAR